MTIIQSKKSRDSIIDAAMRNPDEHSAEIEYRDQWGDCTKRIVSPIRWLGSRKAFLALCTGREEPRRFETHRVLSAKLISSADVMMPGNVENK